jgi:hypothetical protein
VNPADSTPPHVTDTDFTDTDLADTDFTDADLAAVGLTVDDVTPELLARLERAGRLLADTPAPAPPPELVRRWDAALAELDARSAAAPPAAPAGTDVPGPAPATPDHTGTDVPGRPAADPAPTDRPTRPRVHADLAFPAGRFSSPTPFSVPRVRRRWTAGAAGLAVTAAAAVAALIALPGSPAGPPTSHPPAQSLSAGDLPLGGRDYGPLSDPGRLAGCLARVGTPGATVLGARQVDWAGRPGVLLVLPTATPGRPRVLVVSPDCAADTGSLLADTTAGR